ncbi:hypothetical protein EJ06DRAFT_203543 [Trichodelitschia bisporula]|uniref:Uncharacterized protein n=1 Tax=Trichodelitschia bisporula TaxID=703511 RepID=A0A6G1I8M6_9PEZI|nr:hypothetical protein EJ06DRAFT_203543 [Trichodelitschia bisporula]
MAHVSLRLLYTSLVTPLLWTFTVLSTVLGPFWRLFCILASPFVYFARLPLAIVARCASFLAQFEPLYAYFFAAAIIGVGSAYIVSLISNQLSAILGIDSEQPVRPPFNPVFREDRQVEIKQEPNPALVQREESRRGLKRKDLERKLKTRKASDDDNRNMSRAWAKHRPLSVSARPILEEDDSESY